MADQLPDPPVPEDVDLRGMEFMPLKGDVLFKSTTWLKGSHEARCAALRLWWHSFAHEVPASSLPDDDYLLAEYAGYGEVVKAWQKIKPQAMRGWILCDDGRWYHKVVAELALEAWKGRVKNREKVRKWREKQAGGNSGGNGNGGGDVPVTGGGVKPVRNRREGEGQLELQGKGEIIDHDSAAASSSSVAARGTKPETPTPVARPADDDPGPIPVFLDRAPDAALKLWQEAARIEGWPAADFLNSTRRHRLLAILAACGGLEGWRAALEHARDAEFLRRPDGTPQPWFDLDWMLDESHFTRLMEGRYAERRTPQSRPADGGAPTVADGVAAAFARRYAQPG